MKIITAPLDRLVIPDGGFKTILVDPPWKYDVPMKRKDSRKGRLERPGETMLPPYPMMDFPEIAALPVFSLAAENCHLWLWTTNRYLPDALDLCKIWGFKFFHLVTWVKPSGIGMWFIHRTQPLIFAYRGKLGMQRKCNPNVIFSGNPKRHSEKPGESYDLIEAVSASERVELFARRPRDGWTVWGNEV
jgi:N6-adenosine-specific RNA methylase IME4